MYTDINYKTKKALKTALAEGKQIGVYSPGPFGCPSKGTVTLEGPHYPEPHRWYARAQVQNGVITKILA